MHLAPISMPMCACASRIDETTFRREAVSVTRTLRAMPSASSLVAAVNANY